MQLLPGLIYTTTTPIAVQLEYLIMKYNPETSFSNHTLSVINFILAITSGWALKNIVDGVRFTVLAFTLLLLQSILCFLRFSHPNAGGVLRKICYHTSFLTQLLGMPLVLTDILQLTERFSSIWLYITIAINVCAGSTWLLKRKQHNVLALNISMLWNIAVLAYVATTLNECYWTIGLIVLVLQNHFLLPRLALHYDILPQEIATVGLCFFVMFAVNSINELAAFPKHSIA